MTLANKLQTAFVNNTSWEDMEQIARDQFTEELFRTAADLFDPNTALNLADEYHRGVVELVQRMTGSDDKDDVAQIISERTSTAHMLTAADFGTGINGDLLYIGPMEPAQAFIKAHDNTVLVERVAYSTGLWRVELSEGNSFGVGDTVELAWRYALAAEFGPIDEGFTPFRLTIK